MKDIHDYRIGGLAIIDLVLTIIGVIIIHYYMWKNPIHKDIKRTKIQYILSLLLIFITFLGIGFILHWIFGIDSRLSLYLGI